MDSITIGRSKECDVVVTGDPTVSGVHCRISRVGGKYVFENLGRNGSTLNGSMLTGATVIAANAPVMIGSRTQLPWVIIQRLLPLGPVQAQAQAPRPRPVPKPQPPTVPSPQPVVYQQPAYEEPVYEEEYRNPDDTCNFGWWILAFFFPLVGFILFFVWKSSKPNRARKCCLIPAIISVAINVTITVITILSEL